MPPATSGLSGLGRMKTLLVFVLCLIIAVKGDINRSSRSKRDQGPEGLPRINRINRLNWKTKVEKLLPKSWEKKVDKTEEERRRFHIDR